MDGIAAGETTAVLTFEVLDRSGTDITVDHEEANADDQGCVETLENVIETPVDPGCPIYPPVEYPEGGGSVQPSMNFADVKENDWFYEAVKYVFDRGLVNGVSDTAFAPNATTTRGMVVTVLYRLVGEPVVSGQSGFSDVEAGAWYADAVAWAAAKGIVNGDGDRFFPEEEVTREQFAAILYRYAKYKGMYTAAGADLSGYTDADQVSDWAQEAMEWAVFMKLITGRTTTVLAPQGSATRGEMATILMRYLQNV